MRRRSFLGAVAGGSMVGLTGCLGDPEYTVTNAIVQSSSGPLSLSVSVTNPTATIDGPAELALRLTNSTKAPVRIRNQGIWPFGVLSLAKKVESGAVPPIGLYSHAYLKSEHVEASPDRDSMILDGVYLNHRLAADESISETYQLYGDDVINTGKFYIVGTFERPILSYATEKANWSPYRPRAQITVQRKRRLPI